MTASPPTRRRWGRFVVKWTVWAVVAWFAVSCVVVHQLTRRPTGKFDEHLPKNAPAGNQSIRLTTSDGQELGAWFSPGDHDKPIVIAFHGNVGSRSGEASRQDFLFQNGYAVLRVTQRAHGDSTGESNDFGWSNRHDAVAAVEWAKANHPGRPIVVWGHSLGSATALFAAKMLGESVRAYILESPYRDLLTATRNRTRMSLPPVLDHIAYAGLRTAAIVMLPNATTISPYNAAANVPVTAKVLILSGELDRHATLPEAEDIHFQLGARSQWVVIPGARHGQLQAIDPEKFRSIVLNFLESVK
jgi:alpha-beta hydrolase superfamily lysophospholipase